MIKKLLLIISVIVVGYYLYYGFQQMKMAQAPEVDLYSQIPSDAILVLEVEDFSNQWKNIESNSIIWDEISHFEEIKNLEQIFNSLDSSISNSSIYNKEDLPPVLFSILESENTQFLIQTKKPNKVDLGTYLEFISKSLHLKKNIINEVSFSLSNKSITLHGILNQNIISISTEKRVLDKINSPRPNKILNDDDFVSVKNTSSKNIKNRLFIRTKAVTKSLGKYTSDQTQLEIAIFPETSSWNELDLDIKPDEISMGGIAIATDSLNHWLSIFENQEAMSPTVTKYLPNQTAFLLHYGFSDFNKLRKKITARNTKLQGRNFNQPILRWDSIYDISIHNHFLNWVENEIAISIIEPERAHVESEVLAWVNSSDAQTMMNNLNEIALKVDNKKELDFFQITYKNHSIQKLNISDFLNRCFGYPFSIVSENYYTKIEDFVVFSNSPATLQWTIDRHGNGKTLNADPSYQNFTQRISGSSNVLLYSNISKSPNIYKHIASKKVKTEIEKNLEFFQKFQGFTIQISHEHDNYYYVNNYIKYNPVNKKMPNTLWETTISNPTNFKPLILKNHYTQAKEIFIQDTANIIYLINNKGNVLWKKELNEAIISDVSQIDIYNNNKLQIAFNTTSKMYILDRNGKDLINFPISLPQPASAAVLITDYEMNKKYRFIIPTVNGDILNYNTKGNAITGWNYSKNTVPITEKLSYINIHKKDYLIAIFKDGSIKALNRKGQVRLNLKSKLNFAPKSGYIIQKGSDLSSTYILTMTAQQDVVQISLADKKDNLFSITKDVVQFVKYANVDQNPNAEIITVGNNKITSYTTDNQQISRFSLRQEVSFTPDVYQFSNQKLYGFVSTDKNKIYLTDSKGEFISPFPLNGSSPFTITDINNDGRLNLITVGKNGTLFNYTL